MNSRWRWLTTVGDDAELPKHIFESIMCRQTIVLVNAMHLCPCLCFRVWLHLSILTKDINTFRWLYICIICRPFWVCQCLWHLTSSYEEISKLLAAVRQRRQGSCEGANLRKSLFLFHQPYCHILTGRTLGTTMKLYEVEYTIDSIFPIFSSRSRLPL